MPSFTCNHCKQIIKHNDLYVSGYATNDKGQKICYVCCGMLDKQHLIDMKIGNKTVHYLDESHDVPYVINWPNTLRICVHATRNSVTNFGHTRLDLWFTLRDNDEQLHYFWGKQIGHNNQIAHIRKVKEF